MAKGERRYGYRLLRFGLQRQPGVSLYQADMLSLW